MRQAHGHIEPGNTHYQEIKDLVLGLAKNWNETHTAKCDPQVIFDACKRIFKYHKWISIDDIKPAFDLGLMGDFGENKGLNNETIYKWFVGLYKRKSQTELKQHSAYKSEKTFIPTSQRKATREELIKTFMIFYERYQATGSLGSEISQFVPVFYRWFKKLGYIQVTEDQEVEIAKFEARKLRDIRTLLNSKNDPKNKTQMDIFLDAFKIAADKKFDIKTELEKLPL